MTFPDINFFKGHPTKTLLPRQQLADAFKKVLVDTDYLDYDNDPLNQPPLTYGTDPGNLDVRKTIATWSDRFFNITPPTDPNAINLTGGASYGIANILTSLTSPLVTERIFVVSPTYFLINFAFVDAGFKGKITAVNETPGGDYEIDLDYLEAQLKKYSEGKPQPGEEEINVYEDYAGRGTTKLYRFVIYLVPTYSNPGGLTYSLETRTKLLALARRYDLLIVSDDVYDVLNYGEGQEDKKVLKFSAIDHASLPPNFKFGNTVSNSSFSKLIAPGLRVGWQETASPSLANQLASTGANKSGGTPSQLNSLVVADLIETRKLDDIIRNFNTTYRKRADTLLKAMEEHLPKKYTTIYGGHGGYFLWVEIKAPNFDMQQINKILKQQYNVTIPDGSNFEVIGDAKGLAKYGARLCTALLTEKEITEGIERWGQVIKQEHPELYNS